MTQNRHLDTTSLPSILRSPCSLESLVTRYSNTALDAIQEVILPAAQFILGQKVVTIKDIVTEISQFACGSRFGTPKNKCS
jgi:hypothetical protein